MSASTANKVGFAKVDITPPLGVCIAGYYTRREATGILDPLYAFTLSVAQLDEKGSGAKVCPEESGTAKRGRGSNRNMLCVR